MGMTRAKSLLEIKEGQTFLDVIVRQVLHLRAEHDAAIPLLLMNSFATRDDTLEALKKYPELEIDGLPLDFVQGKVPKLLADGFEPVSWEADPALEWAPPGHGDVFTSLATSGTLSTLLERGYEYLFLSNSDNLGAVLDPRILSWFASEELPFLSEVVDRTEADRKGGHLARRRDGGGLVLRETAQVPEEDQDAFEDVAAPSLLQRQQHLGEPARARADARGARRDPRAADDREPQDRGSHRPLVPRGRAARDRDGGGDRRVRRRRGGARAAPALHAREDHERSAGGALGCVRAGGRLDDPAHAGARGGAAREAVERVQAAARLRRALPGRRSLAARRGGSWRSRATCASGRAWWCAGACGWRGRRRFRTGRCWRASALLQR